MKTAGERAVTGLKAFGSSYFFCTVLWGMINYSSVASTVAMIHMDLASQAIITLGIPLIPAAIIGVLVATKDKDTYIPIFG